MTDSYLSKEDRFLVISQYSDPREIKSEMLQSSRRGAGAILFSSLVYQGWKFPPFILTDSDERYLFDLEVHHKTNNFGFKNHRSI